MGAFRLAAGNTGQFMLVCIPLLLMLSVLLALGFPCGSAIALSCLERVDRAQPGTGVEGTPESSNRARSNILGVPSTSAAAAAPSPSRRRQGLLSFGMQS